MKKNDRNNKFVRYLKRTWKNKVIAILTILLGIVYIPFSYEPSINGYDGTATLLLLIVGSMLFFAKDNWVR